MPYDKKGASSARKPNPRTGTPAGSRSPKHRGHRADEAPGKNRWSNDDRDYRAARDARSVRGESNRKPVRDHGRPDWAPKPAESRYDRSQRRDDRFAEERGFERPARDERPARGGRDERPARGGFNGGRDDRAPRSFDRADRPARDDRPARGGFGGRDERPARGGFAGGRDDRAPRSFDRAERPAREDRARRFDADDRGPRAERGSRPEWAPRDGGARRTHGDRPRTERPERTYGSEGGFGAHKPTFQDDVVLERLEAQAVQAADVEGVTFGDLGLGGNIVRELAELGASAPFPIQAATIPQVLAGRDVLGRGRTGSGKTIAFGAPLVERLMENGGGRDREFGRSPRALILAPTRELALQIDRTVQPIARSVGLFTTQIYGGVPFGRQLGALERGVDIVIGTPGRVQDLARRGQLDLSKVKVAVLDEADLMCDLGFLEPVQEILRETQRGGQKLLFSATLDKGVAELVDEFLENPAVHEVAGEDQASATIDHRVLVVDRGTKPEIIRDLVSGGAKSLVFTRTRAYAEQLADELEDMGIRSVSLHGDLNQARRTRNLGLLTSGRVNVLVATDVAARGIHVDDITLVIQADAPDEYKTYLHRSGRTGRAGREGTVVTLVPHNRQRRTQELLERAEIKAEFVPATPGDALIESIAAQVAPKHAE
jgi:superfamily II DNA/RNA helicase